MTGIIKGQQAGPKLGLVIMRTVRQMRGKMLKRTLKEAKFYSF